MGQILFQRVDGKPMGEPLALPRARRRLSVLVRRHADHSRPYLVSVHRRQGTPAAEPLAVTDMSVRLRKTWAATTLGPRDTVIITYLPRGGGGGSSNSGSSRAGKTGSIGLLVATIALAAVGQFWAIGAINGAFGLAAGSAVGSTIWAAASATSLAGPSLFISRRKDPNMTAVNAFLRGEAAYIFTDGKTYTRDGDPIGGMQKVEIMAHLPAILATRGQAVVFRTLTYRAAEVYRTFDELVTNLAEAVHAARDSLGVPADASVLDLTAVGWSDQRQRIEIWSVADLDRPGVPAFEPHEVFAAISPLDDRMMRNVQTAGLDIEHSEPEALGLALLRMQRDRAWPLAHSGRMIESVGKFAQMTVLRRDRIETRILERWTDAA